VKFCVLLVLGFLTLCRQHTRRSTTSALVASATYSRVPSASSFRSTVRTWGATRRKWPLS